MHFCGLHNFGYLYKMKNCIYIERINIYSFEIFQYDKKF